MPDCAALETTTSSPLSGTQPSGGAPGGRFSMTLDGRVVRQDDQVHLSTYGASLVANLIIGALRRDGLVA